MKQAFWFFFFPICALLELVLAYLFPVNTFYNGYSFLFHICLLALICFVLYKGTVDRLLYGLLFGLIYDFFIGFCFPYCAIYFTLAAYLAGMISLMKRPIKIAAILLVCFGYDLIPTLFYMSQGILTNSLGQFLLYLELPALAINFFTLWLINMIYTRKSRQDASFAYLSIFNTTELL